MDSITQPDYNIIRNRKERYIRTVLGRNPISDLISGILNARDASRFDRGQTQARWKER